MSATHFLLPTNTNILYPLEPNISDLYSGHAPFKYRPDHHVSWLSCSSFLSVPPDIRQHDTFNQDTTTSYPFSCIILYHPIRSYIVSATVHVVKWTIHKYIYPLKCQLQLGFVISYADTVTSRNSFLHCTPSYVRANSSLIMQNLIDAPVTLLLPKQLKTL